MATGWVVPKQRMLASAGVIVASGSERPRWTRQDARRVLSREQARRVYEAAAAQVNDAQSVYGAAATGRLKSLVDFSQFHSVLEFGCGSGRLAKDLLQEYLSDSALYVGVDQTPAMVELASKRLGQIEQGSARTRTLLLEDGDPAKVPSVLERAGIPNPGSFDCVLSCYVLDLLSEDDIISFLRVAKWALEGDQQAPAEHGRNKRLCLIGLTYGAEPLTRLVSSVWDSVHAVFPSLVGGCRPQKLRPYVEYTGFSVEHLDVVSGGGISSEVCVAKISN